MINHMIPLHGYFLPSDLENLVVVIRNASVKSLVIHNSLGACECVHCSNSHSM